MTFYRVTLDGVQLTSTSNRQTAITALTEAAGTLTAGHTVALTVSTADPHDPNESDPFAPFDTEEI